MDFSEEQQKHIDKMISKRIAEVKNKAEAEHAEQLAASAAKHAEEVETLKGQVEKLTASQGQSNERIRAARLEAEISRTSAVSVSQVHKLISDNIRLGANDNLEIVDEKGVVRLDEAGSPLSVKAYLEGFLHENPHLAKSTPSTGAGSFGAKFTGDAGEGKMRRAAFDGLDATRKHDYIRGGGTVTD